MSIDLLSDMNKKCQLNSEAYITIKISGGTHTVKTKPRFGNALPVLGVKPKRGWYVFWLFFKIGLMFSHIIRKVSARAFR